MRKLLQIASNQSGTTTRPARNAPQLFVSRQRIAAPTMAGAAASITTSAMLFTQRRHMATYGKVTNEDRRWWLIHLECSPDVVPGTFHAWLDSCGTHTTKKLIERNIWSVEQVAQLSSDEVDELRFKEGCLHMDVVWEHARTVMPALLARATGGGVENELKDKILELRKRRELERRKAEIISERREVAEDRQKTLQELRESIARKKEALRQKQASRQQEQEEGEHQQEQQHESEAASKEETVAEKVERIKNTMNKEEN